MNRPLQALQYVSGKNHKEGCEAVHGLYLLLCYNEDNTGLRPWGDWAGSPARDAINLVPTPQRMESP